MSIFDKVYEKPRTIDPDVLAKAINNVYKEADKKRDELIKAYSTSDHEGDFDRILASINLPSYQELKDRIASHTESHIVFRKPCG